MGHIYHFIGYTFFLRICNLLCIGQASLFLWFSGKEFPDQLCGTVTGEMKCLLGKQNCFKLKVLILRLAKIDFISFEQACIGPKS